MPQFGHLREWAPALLAGAGAGLVYTGAVIGYSLLPSSGVSFSGSVLWTAAISALLSFGAIGLPVALWVRYRLRSPLALMGGILLFWHVLVYVPPIGSGQGDSPGFLFVFVFAPFYIVGYGILAGVEGWLSVGEPSGG